MIPSARVGVAPPTGLVCVCGAAPSILPVGLGVVRVYPGQDRAFNLGEGRSRPTRAPGTSPPLSLGKVSGAEGGPPRPGRVGGCNRISGLTLFSPQALFGNRAPGGGNGPEASEGSAPGEQRGLYCPGVSYPTRPPGACLE